MRNLSVAQRDSPFDVCPHCARRLPRAATRCLWCSGASELHSADELRSRGRSAPLVGASDWLMEHRNRFAATARPVASESVSSDVLIVVRVPGEPASGSNASAIADQAQVALRKGKAIMRRFGIPVPESLTRLVWYVRSDGADDADCATLMSGAFFKDDDVKTDLHFVQRMDHPDTLVELDIIAHFALGADGQSPGKLELSHHSTMVP